MFVCQTANQKIKSLDSLEAEKVYSTVIKQTNTGTVFLKGGRGRVNDFAKELNNAKKKYNTSEFNEKANKLISELYIKFGIANLDMGALNWACKYWGDSRPEIYKKLVEKGDKAKTEGKSDEARKCYELASQFEKSRK